jgi:hypothetical protein
MPYITLPEKEVLKKKRKKDTTGNTTMDLYNGRYTSDNLRINCLVTYG